MTAPAFVPDGFAVPRRLEGSGFVLEPLGPEHNDSDHRAWGGSIAHIHATPGFAPGDWGDDTWPYPMTADENLADLRRHADEFERCEAFAYTVLDGDGSSGEVIGCVYIDPDPTGIAPAMMRCWVRADRAHLDVPLAAAIRQWLQRDWPFAAVRFPGREGR